MSPMRGILTIVALSPAYAFAPPSDCTPYCPLSHSKVLCISVVRFLLN